MKRKTVWIIAPIAILIFSISISLLYLYSPDEEPDKIYKYVKPSSNNDNPPHKAKPGYKMVIHDDHWHEVPVEDINTSKKEVNLTQSEIDALNRKLQQEGFEEDNLSERELLYLSSVGVDWDLLTPEQKYKYDKDYYDRYDLDVPPPGYRYILTAPGKPQLDSDGKPILLKEGDIYITVRYGQGFAPTLDDYNRIQYLEREVIKSTDPDEISSMQNEIDDIKSSSQGKIPIGATAVGGENLSSNERELKVKEALNNAYIELNLSHLISN